MLDVIIIGAGPYGISIAAHAVAKKLSYKLFGYPMDFWTNQMPQNMYIRTPHDLVSFSYPEGNYTIQQFAEETRTILESPLPRTVFVRYAFWFAERAGIQFTTELVRNLSHNGQYYTITAESGDKVEAKNVVIATGVKDFQYIPSLYSDLPRSHVSHTLGITSFDKFRGKDVIVVGSGQSAWEAAALLHQARSKVKLLYRKKKHVYGGSRVAELILIKTGDIFYKLPRPLKKLLRTAGSVTVPIAHFLKPLVEEKVPRFANRTINQVSVVNNKVQLKLTNGEEIYADYVIVASGFKIHLDKLTFVEDLLKNQIVREEESAAFPKLNQNFESNLKGLFFAGPLSAHSHGPTFRFILGLDKASKTIIRSITTQEES
ncbi:NAD(P)-binding domain-containing protein [Paenibacillus glycanilyticus]|uniref:NAD(P)-binding domain-containing protein n=1 Tax=Paenibacillus glycanilyticus TaxID=126569 RepID=UPI00203F490C|nr:NAD(P)-binding domain-containing protein [Paenibacillus glycanilyticus]MCM3630000.1 NAD(P)-binding domain-containing protein [Paenibacillus glycanilyticus]